MLNKNDILKLKVASDTILVKGKATTKTVSGIILDEKTTKMEDINSINYEIIQIHPECFTNSFFIDGIPQKGDTVIVNKYDARKIFEDSEEFIEDGKVYKEIYYLIKDTNVLAYINNSNKGE